MWKPEEDFTIIFDDKTGDFRSEKELDNMVEAMRTVANEYGFDLSSWGSARAMQKSAALHVFSQICTNLIAGV